MSEQTHYIVETELGAFAIALDLARAPATAGYFRELLDSGVFDGSTVFRIVRPDNVETRTESPIDVVQLGHFDMDDNPAQSFAHEGTNVTGLSHVRWTISAARGDVGQNYPSFFICMRDEPALDHGGTRHPDGQGFAAFGAVTRGFDTVRRLRDVAESGEILAQPVPIHHVSRSA